MRHAIVCLTALALATGANRAHAVKFMALGDLAGGIVASYAYGISADGSVVVGHGYTASGQEAFRWTASGGMVGLGDLTGGMVSSEARGTSTDGSVVVGFSGSTSGTEAFRWTSGGGMVGLGDLDGGSFFSRANAVSSDGSVVAGCSNSASDYEAFHWTVGSGMVGLGDLDGGSFSSAAYAVSADGSVVVGYGLSASGQEAFRWTSSGGMVGLGDLDGGAFSSGARAVSTDGSVVVGFGYSASGREAFRWTSGGGMVGLGDFDGGSFCSEATAVSADGSVIVGLGTSASASEAFIWDGTNGMRNLRTDILQPVVGSAIQGWTLYTPEAISDDGRTVVGYGQDPAGHNAAWLAYLDDEIHWFPNAGGCWDEIANWSGPFMPGAADDVLIDPDVGVTVVGPWAITTVNSLAIGAQTSGVVRLMQGAGDINVAQTLTVESRGELEVAGTIRTLPGGDGFITNHGVITGNGQIDSAVWNYGDGELRVGPGQSLRLTGNAITVNEGRIEVIGGELEFTRQTWNTYYIWESGYGTIVARDATLRFGDGSAATNLFNDASLAFSAGTSDVFGDVLNASTGVVTVSGKSTVTFWDDFTNQGTATVSTGSTAVFFGLSGNGVGGGGDKFIEGDLRPGFSPSEMEFGGNVYFGPLAELEIELGGLVAGDEYDRLIGDGMLQLDGVLNVVLLDGSAGPFAPQLGDTFDILDWSTLDGEFDEVLLPGLESYLAWDTDDLYVTGEIAVTYLTGLGDANLDGLVDDKDASILGAHWQQQSGATWMMGDFNGDNKVNDADAAILAAHWGEGVGGAAVPEPGSLALLAGIAVMGLIYLRRRKA